VDVALPVPPGEDAGVPSHLYRRPRARAPAAAATGLVPRPAVTPAVAPTWPATSQHRSMQLRLLQYLQRRRRAQRRPAQEQPRLSPLPSLWPLCRRCPTPEAAARQEQFGRLPVRLRQLESPRRGAGGGSAARRVPRRLAAEFQPQERHHGAVVRVQQAALLRARAFRAPTGRVFARPDHPSVD